MWFTQNYVLMNKFNSLKRFSIVCSMDAIRGGNKYPKIYDETGTLICCPDPIDPTLQEYLDYLLVTYKNPNKIMKMYEAFEKEYYASGNDCGCN